MPAPLDANSSATGRAASSSATTLETSRILPQISFRLLLGIVTGAALLAFSVRMSQQGAPIAMALTYTALFLALAFVAFAILFLIAWLPAVIGRDHLQDVHRGNPFSIDQLPPQVLPPRDPGT